MSPETRRVAQLGEYLGVPVDGSTSITQAARAFGCTEAYVLAEPELPPVTCTVLARMGDELSGRDQGEARRFAAYLLCATDD